jgi:hypothetical protein
MSGIKSNVQAIPDIQDNTADISSPIADIAMSDNPSLESPIESPEGARPDFDKLDLMKIFKIPEISIYREVTKHIPGQAQYSIIYDAIRKIKDKHDFGRPALVAYLAPFWKEWAGVRAYRRAGLAWLTEWAIAGAIPKQGGNGYNPAPVQSDFHLPNPSSICSEGQRLKRQAEEKHDHPNFGDILLEYQDHLTACRFCGESITTPEVLEQIDGLTEKMRIRK